jgi:hypothetical protein
MLHRLQEEFCFRVQFNETLERNSEFGRNDAMKVKSNVRAGEGNGLDPHG